MKQVNEKYIASESIPAQLIDSIIAEISPFTTCLLKGQNSNVENPIPLIASGTFVSAYNLNCILTAHHVANEIRNCDALGLSILSDQHQFWIKRADFRIVDVGTPADITKPCEGPDIAVIILLSQSKVASIKAAGKVFYNLEKRLSVVLENPQPTKLGLWFVVGFPGKWRTSTRTTGNFEFLIGNLGLFGYGPVKSELDLHGFDLVDLGVNYNTSGLPDTFGGVSGGGLWHVLLQEKEDGSLGFHAPILSGVAFCEMLEKGVVNSVRSHGRRSIYERAYEALKNYSH
ncbi:MAG: hypothetical protein A2Z27_02205 [candidate division Zixibacteria bacterium RBG_16_50_21]|nr:MAG: hypothetical protein A2Z27_02205 [candidate division Zixibacteria bacterium RBG_16_50_21]